MSNIWVSPCYFCARLEERCALLHGIEKLAARQERCDDWCPEGTLRVKEEKQI